MSERIRRYHYEYHNLKQVFDMIDPAEIKSHFTPYPAFTARDLINLITFKFQGRWGGRS